MRAGLEDLRADVERSLRSGEGGAAACRRFSEGVEALVRRAVGSSSEDSAGLAVLAAGGLARRELAPRADVDLHFVLDPAAGQEALVEKALYALWDAGLVLGHSVRTLDDMIACARDDEQAATALLEARPVAGDERLAARALDAFWSDALPALREELRATKLNELRERRARFGGSVHLVEPNVKSSPGGLRDVHSLTWVGLLTGSRAPSDGDAVEHLLRLGLLHEREAVALRESTDEILGIRAALHVVTGRAEDRLLFEHQAAIAEMLGIESSGDETASEALMRRYFRAALRARRSVDDGIERLVPRASASPDVSPPEPLGGGLAATGGHLVVEDAALFRRAPARMIDAVRMAEECRLPLSPRTRSYVYAALEEVGGSLATDASCARALLDLARSALVTGAPFTALLEMGVLGAVLPDIGRLEGRFKHDGYHAYTTDAHICRCTDLALQAASGTEPPPAPLLPALERTSRAHLVVLGALMHDIGKGLGGDHSETGAAIAAREAARMGLPPDEIDILRFLVAEHLVLSRASQRRDLSDPAVVEEVARVVKTPERLDLLALLTWVDIAAVAPGMMTDWKARLLGLAVERVRAFLLEPEGGAFLRGEHEAEVRQQARDLLLGAAPDDVVERFVAGASVRTLASRLEPDLVDDLRTFARYSAGGDPVVTSAIAEGGHAHNVRVVCEDRRGLLADLASALSSQGANVLHANIDAREDGVVVDAFRIDDGQGGAVDDEVIEHARVALEEAGRASSGPPARRAASSRRRTGPALTPRVRAIEGADTWGAVIVELRGEDRPGLVADVARVFSTMGWNIVLAKINTEGRVVRDSFYVQPDPNAGSTSDRRSLEEALLRCLEEG